MAFPSNVTSPAEAAKSVFGLARLMRSEAAKYIQQCDAGSLNLHEVAVGFLGYLSNAKQSLVTYASVAGLYDELVRVKPDAFASAAAAQTAYVTAQDAVTNMILFLEANIPVDGSRRILSLILSNNGSGVTTARQITVQASLDTFTTNLITFRDAFEA